MVDASVAKQLVQAIIDNLPSASPRQEAGSHHRRGREGRVRGVGRGAHLLHCRALQRRAHLGVGEVLQRIGGVEQHDGWSDVRGMATRFHIPGERASDLIATTLGEFFVRNVDDFFEFTKIAKHETYQRRSRWRKVGDLLQLKIPPRNPYPDETNNVDEGALRYANRHRFAQLGIFQVGLIGAPESYARASYHAIHTFWVTAPDGVRRPVRFSWQPVAGVRNTNPKAVPRRQISVRRA